MNRRLRLRLVAGLAAIGAITACVVDPLNPQPLPPGEPQNGATFGIDGGARGPEDASAQDESEGGSSADAANADGGDAGNTDAGDAGDAG